jgi:hypothetical protein
LFGSLWQGSMTAPKRQGEIRDTNTRLTSSKHKPMDYVHNNKKFTIKKAYKRSYV